MRILWDEPKRLANLDKHGLDFVDLDLEFFFTAVVRPAKMGRLMAIGRLGNGVIVVIFVRLDSEGLSIISMLAARKTERGLLNGKEKI
ncbi:hypothetical protein DTW90_09700 [Neorhizobium sp. P12A]|jgi:uncharacterized DUF497 family protein|uniref:BrnT family toxin n=1 Tax=Neorhizobium sp. P12A TaxID=2268027 RepID=UPI0011EDAB50|nr:BrnT family toxin [Neorhizobium sp. P12A]KAA0699627.1 hypothetical protein DTW90_09700 [Neorhizobium sp. P12A]